MNVGPLSGGFSVIQSAQNRVTEAAQAIAQVPVKQQAQGVKGPGDLKSTDYVRPLMSLNEAKLQAQVGGSVIEADMKMIGSLFDAMA